MKTIANPINSKALYVNFVSCMIKVAIKTFFYICLITNLEWHQEIKKKLSLNAHLVTVITTPSTVIAVRMCCTVRTSSS